MELGLKITDLESIHLSYPVEEPFRYAWAEITTREMLLVKVHTDEAITGISETAFWGGPAITTRTILEKELKPIIVGEDPFNVERIWDKMYRRTMQHGRRGAVIAAMSGIDTAIWDIVGKSVDKPLYKLLGGFRDTIRAYASAGYYQEGKGPDKLAQEMARFVKQGYTAAKIKTGGIPWRQDVERVAAVREAIGKDVDLMIDSNNIHPAVEAIRLAKAVEKYDIFFFEEPVMADDIQGSAAVNHATGIPVAGYEVMQTRFEYRNFILADALRIVQPDAIWSGGITECRKIAALASAFGLLCIPHNFSSALSMAANMALIASIPNGLLLEVDMHRNPLREELCRPAIKIDKNGYAHLPEGPGLGVELNESVVKKYAVEP